MTTMDPSVDPNLDPAVREFLTELNKNSSAFWELPQPKPQEVLTALQHQTPVDMSGVALSERTICSGGRDIKLHVVAPQERKAGGVLLFIHGGVWTVGNFENHQRFVRDLVVGSGQVCVFVEYTSLPAARFPRQIEECYATLVWIAEHADELGADGRRIAVAGNSVGGNMSAALTLMTKDRGGPAIAFQVLFVPATDAGVDTQSYHDFAEGRFLPREFMRFGWDLYAPDSEVRNHRYASPLRASLKELEGLPPALVITAENDPLRDEGEAYARKLKEAGVSVTAVRYGGTIHDFVLLNALRQVPSTESAIRQAYDAIRAHLEPK